MEKVKNKTDPRAKFVLFDIHKKKCQCDICQTSHSVEAAKVQCASRVCNVRYLTIKSISKMHICMHPKSTIWKLSM